MSKAAQNPPESDSVRTTVSALVIALRDAIVEGSLAPGSKLNIKRLCESYDVSAIPMREALSRLTSTGFVEARDQLGFSVAEVSAFDLADITRARILVESEALRLSLKTGTLLWETELMAAFDRLCDLPMRSKGATGNLSAAWDEAHMNFHHCLLSACGSPVLLDWAGNLRRRSTRYRYVSVLGDLVRPQPASARKAGRPERDVHAEHRQMLEAALQRDAERACDLLRAHLEKTVKLALAVQNEFGAKKAAA